MHPQLAVIGLVSLAVAAIYATLTLAAVLIRKPRRATPPSSSLPPVTLLKPLCGAEPGLYEHLRSFCQQDYPTFELVFGVQDVADPALAIVQRLQAEFPSLPMCVIANPQQHGSNLKTSNLINMLAGAHHDVLVVADSDTWVGRDYLAAVAAPLLDREVGLVTCIYRDNPTAGIWSRLGAMYINEWYMPSVLLAHMFGHRSYVSGQTLCLRRDTLQAIGGLTVIVNHLADDYRLGELVRATGRSIVLSSYVVEAGHHEPSFTALLRHELRWMRTLRVLKPQSFRWIFLSFSLPLAVAGIALSAAQSSISSAAWGLFLTTIAARLLLHVAHRRANRTPWADIWLLPVRDALICWVWCRSFLSSRVTWRGNEFDVDADGIMHRLS